MFDVFCFCFEFFFILFGFGDGNWLSFVWMLNVIEWKSYWDFDCLVFGFWENKIG